MKTSCTKKLVRRDTRTARVNEYQAQFQLGLLTTLRNVTTGAVIPPTTRTFRKVANGHRDFKEVATTA